MTALGPHRSPGERDERPDVVPIPLGPRETCPACGAQDSAYCEKGRHETPCKRGAAPGRCTTCEYHPEHTLRSRVTAPVYCAPWRRFHRGGWWTVWMWWRRCSVGGEHTHQSCRVCGATWINRLVDAIGADSHSERLPT